MSSADRSRRTAALAGVVICGVLLTPLTPLRADGPEQPNDHAIVLSSVSEPLPTLPQDASDAIQTFERRASKILQFAACQRDEGSSSLYRGVSVRRQVRVLCARPLPVRLPRPVVTRLIESVRRQTKGPAA